MSGMNLIHVAAGGGIETVFWGVVIAIFVISQIAKSRKKYTESAPQQQKDADASGDPAEELRKFLEGLGQTQTQAPKPPPTPVVAPPPPPPPQRRVVAHHAKVRVATPPPVRQESSRRRAPAPVPDAPVLDEAAVLARYRAEMAVAVAPARSATNWRAILTSELRNTDRQPARKALVMREIFGAPTSLRRREVVYPLV